jgi:SprT protein
MYCREGERRWFRYNPWILARHQGSLADTVAHEVAHYVVDLVWPPRPGRRRIRPHGREWRSVMAVFDADPAATHDLDLDQVPVRRQRRFAYVCACREHRLTTTTHNRIQRRRWRYACTHCGELLRRKPEPAAGAADAPPGQLVLPWETDR